MAVTAPLTKLEAINAMLHDLGERPVNSLAGTSRLDVTRAIDSLEHVSRALQTMGWWFNQEIVQLTVDGSGNYNIPDDWTHVEVLSGGPTSGDLDEIPKLTVRGRVLFDVNNSTDVFTGADTLKLKIHRLLEYTDLPTNVREYVYASASIRNQSRTIGSASVDADLREQARVSLAAMKEEDIDFENLDQTLAPHAVRLMHNR
jgi:hypothetical protein